MPPNFARVGAMSQALAMVDQQIDSRKRQRTAATIVFFLGLILTPILLGIPMIIFALVNYFRHGSALDSLNKQRLVIVGELAKAQAGG